MGSTIENDQFPPLLPHHTKGDQLNATFPLRSRPDLKRGAQHTKSYLEALELNPTNLPLPIPLPPPLPHVSVRPIDAQAAKWTYRARSNLLEAGDGLFASRPIPAGTKIGEYKGRPELTLSQITSPNYKTHYGFSCHKPLAIRDAQDPSSCAARYINDNLSRWNVKFQAVRDTSSKYNRVDIVSILPIQQHEELSIAYGEAF